MNKLQVLMNGTLGRKVPAEFSAEEYDYEKALLDEMKGMFCDERGKFSRKLWRAHKDDLFDLVAETFDEVLPNSVKESLGMFCEIMQFANGDRPEFRIVRGRVRGKQFVTRATESGNYEAFRLDRDRFDIYPVTIGGAFYMDFERYLEGLEDMAAGYQILLEGMNDRIYEMVQEVLLQSWNLAGRPARNKVAVTSFDAAAMVKLCNTVAAYGAPVIYCSPEFAAEMVNAIIYNSTTKISDQDMIDVRERGYIGKFRGVPVVVMPQSMMDETNEKLAMNPSFAFVIPAGKEKLIKLAFEGDAYARSWEHEGDNSTKLEIYKKVGIAMVSTPNYWGLYYNAGIDAGGWGAYNTALVGSVSGTTWG